MPLSRIVNNVGVGKVEATFFNLTTTNIAFYADTATPITQALVDAGHNACSIIAAQEIAITAATTAPLFGAVLALSQNNNANRFPEKAVVQVSGVAQMRGTTGAIAAPVVNPSFVPTQINGLVACDTTSGVHSLRIGGRGKVINVWNGDWVDVLF